MQKSVRHLYAYLMRVFKIDPKVQKITISIVGNRYREGVYWKVFLFLEHELWKRYLHNVMYRGWPPMLLVQWKNKEVVREIHGGWVDGGGG